jgi:hypothetical protein
VVDKFDLVNIKYRDFVITTWYDDRATEADWLKYFGVSAYSGGHDPRFKIVYHQPPILFKGKPVHIEILDTGESFIPATLPPPLQGL